MRKFTIDQRDFQSADEVHDFIAEKLELPEYYGRNLDALNDCLGDISEPTRITVRRLRSAEGEFAEWFERFCKVLTRNAVESDVFDVVFKRSWF